ncbi:MAG: DNA polymerase subunit beta [Planctomycetes bacterium]|nr:DNA polymerase subunit beta [Planctomycetota bacterium]MBM4083774.1 DNA polymerase subunit beta [Planctomycetota bacterium]
MRKPRIEMPMEKIEAFCRKWKVKEFSLVGSVLRDDFRPDSDVDVLVDLEQDAPWDLFDWVDMIDELKGMLGREVDLIDKTAVRNPFRRRHLLRTHEVIYAA